jgi:hypothetical protein
MAELGGSDYRSGAHDRIEESRLLMLGNRFGGSVYLAGRAVESILRATIWAPIRIMQRGENRWKPGTTCERCLS